MLVHVFKAPQLARDTAGGVRLVTEHRYFPPVLSFSPRQTAVQACVNVILVHVLKRSRRRRLAEVDVFITPVLGPDNHEAAAANAAVVHTHHTNAEDSADKCVDGIAALLEQGDANLAAHSAFRRHGSKLRFISPACWRRGDGRRQKQQKLCHHQDYKSPRCEPLVSFRSKSDVLHDS